MLPAKPNDENQSAFQASLTNFQTACLVLIVYFFSTANPLHLIADQQLLFKFTLDVQHVTSITACAFI